jgi:hypothetical protein
MQMHIHLKMNWRHPIVHAQICSVIAAATRKRQSRTLIVTVRVCRSNSRQRCNCAAAGITMAPGDAAETCSALAEHDRYKQGRFWLYTRPCRYAVGEPLRDSHEHRQQAERAQQRRYKFTTFAVTFSAVWRRVINSLAKPATSTDRRVTF